MNVYHRYSAISYTTPPLVHKYANNTLPTLYNIY